MDGITWALILLLIYFTDQTTGKINFRGLVGGKVFDLKENYTKANLINFDYEDESVGVLIGHWKEKDDQEKESGGDRYKYSVKIEVPDDKNSFNRHESHIYDRIVRNMKKNTLQHYLKFGFTTKKDFIPAAEIRQIPKTARSNPENGNDVVGVSALIVRRGKNSVTLLEHLRTCHDRTDTFYLFEIWELMFRGWENLHVKRQIQLNNIHLRNIACGTQDNPRLGLTNMQMADDLEDKGQRKYYLKDDVGDRKMLIDNNNSTSTLSWNGAIGVERTETDECIMMCITLWETYVDLPFTSNHVYEGLRIDELKVLSVCELLRLRTNYSTERIFELLREQSHWSESNENIFREIFGIIKKNGEITVKIMKSKISQFITDEKKYLLQYHSSEINPRSLERAQTRKRATLGQKERRKNERAK